jgi:hypothetical protein
MSACVCGQCGVAFRLPPSRIARGGGRRCSRECAARARFWSQVILDGPVPAHAPELGTCWLWTGRTTQAGYRQMKDRGEQLAHRVAWRLHGGTLHRGQPMRHLCDVRRCARPAHVLPGTPAENNADMVARGRQRGAPGERNAHARLTAEQVAALRRAFVPRRVTRAMLAEENGVTVSAIKKIILGATWRSVAGAPRGGVRRCRPG